MLYFFFFCCSFDNLRISSSGEIFFEEILKFPEHDWAWIVYSKVGCVDSSIVEKVEK